MVDFILERQAQMICLEGRVYHPAELPQLQSELEQQLATVEPKSAASEQLRFKLELTAFLRDWFAESPTLEVKTSGSTGVPKRMQVSKERMMHSAQLTLEFLHLQRGDSALLCMPLEYIAGKMVVVRALVGGLDLYPVAPCGQPLAPVQGQKHAKLPQPLKFAAMIPLQVYNSLQDERQRQALREIEQLIIGGGAIDESLEQELSSFPHYVWSTYGMTETLSHIALRRVNGPEASEYYQPFAHVHLELSADDTLVIDAPLVAEERFVTNDIVVFNDNGQFRIKGRKDNVINSGGVKLQIEELEAKIKALQPKWDFQISSQPHPKFGQIVVLLVTRASLHSDSAEGELAADQLDAVRAIIKDALHSLPRYEQPKRFLLVEALPRTGTNKPDRAQAKLLAAQATAEL